MEKLQILIYLAVGVIAIVYSVYKNMNKQKKQPQQRKQVPNTYKAPGQQQSSKNNNQNKSLEDLINTLLNDQQGTVNKEVKKEVIIQETYSEASSLELQNQEAQYYAQDTELEFNSEMEDYDIKDDHRMLENSEIGSIQVEEKSEWAKTDWGKAVILAEVLQRPQY